MTRKEFLAVLHAIEDAGYAMVGGNLDKELLPPECVTGWLLHITEVLESQYSVNAMASSPDIISTDSPQ